MLAVVVDPGGGLFTDLAGGAEILWSYPIHDTPCWLSLRFVISQVDSLTIRPERPLVVMSMTRPRRSFGLPCKLVDRDAYDWLTDDYMAKVRREKIDGGGVFVAMCRTKHDRSKTFTLQRYSRPLYQPGDGLRAGGVCGDAPSTAIYISLTFVGIWICSHVA